MHIIFLISFNQVFPILPICMLFFFFFFSSFADPRAIFPNFNGPWPRFQIGKKISQLLIQFYTGLFETAHIFSRLCRCACGLDINFKFIFVIFYHFLIFLPQKLLKCIDSGYL